MIASVLCTLSLTDFENPNPTREKVIQKRGPSVAAWKARTMELVESAHWMDDEADCYCPACVRDIDFYEWQADRVRPGKRCRSSAEQVGRCRFVSPAFKRYEKRYTVRLMRRTGRQFLDDAPKRIPFRGWAD